MRSSLLLLPLPLLALAACTAGPDYDGPASASAPAAPEAFTRAGETVNATAPAPAHWWTGLGDPILNNLVDQALANNPDLAMAQARLYQARAGLRLDRANRLPNGNASIMYAHAQLPGLDLGSLSSDSNNSGSDQESSGGGGSEALNFYNLGFDASWELDLFGGQRRTVEASRASMEAAQANVADAQVSLAAEVANAYVNLRDRQQRLAFAEQAAERQHEALDLTRQRFARGTTSALDVERQQSLAEQSDSALLPLKAERDAYLNALAILTGQVPGALDAQLATATAIPLPPASVAVGDPAALLQRRPDIRAAERQLAAATAKIGVAEAARFPHISFMGILGIGGTKPESMFDLDNLAAIALPQIKWNIFDLGRNSARIGQAEGGRDEAAARYRKAVLGALRDAEDSLSRYGTSRQTVASAARTRASAERTVALTRQRFASGTASRIEVLDAERQLINADQSLTQATAAMTANYIAVQKALGLGWN